MATAKRTKGILEHLRRAVVAFDDVAAVKWCRIALEERVDPFVATMEGLTPGMIEISDLYTREEYFVPEILMCVEGDDYLAISVAIRLARRKILTSP